MIRHLLTRLLYMLLVAFVLASAGLYALAGTAPGTRLLLDAAIRLGGLPAQITQTHGSLLGGLELEGVTWKGAAADVRIARARVRWRALDLLAGRLHLDRLTATHVRVTLTTNAAPVKAGNTPPHLGLPLTVVLAHFELRNLIVVRSAQTWHVPFIQASAALHGNRLTLASLHVAMRAGELQARGEARLTPPYRNHLRLAWHWRMADGTRLAGDGTLGGDLQRLDLTQHLNTPLPALLTGHIEPQKMSADLALSWHDAHWPLQGTAQFQSPQGKLTFNGSIDTYAARLKAAVQGKGFPPATITLNGKGSHQSFDMHSLRVNTLGGTVSGSGTITWSPALHWRADLKGSGLNPADYLSQWPGNLGFALRAEGTRNSATIDLTRLAGTLRKLAFLASAKARVHGKKIDIASARLKAGGGQVTASGQASRRQGRLTLSFRLPQLQKLLPTAHGSLQGHASIDGPWNWPRVNASIHADGLSWKNTRAARVSLNVTSGTGRQLDARLEVERLRRGAIRLHSVQVQLSGTPAEQRLRLALTAPQGQASLVAAGGFGKDYRQWQGQLQHLQISPTKSSTWRLTAPVALQLGRQTRKLGVACLRPVTGGDAQLCTHFVSTVGKLDATADVSALPLQILDAWLPNTTHLAGQLDGKLHLQGPLQNLAGELRARLLHGELRLHNATGQHQLSFAVPALDATLREGGVSTHIRAQFPQQKARLDLSAKVGAPHNGARELAGNVQLDLPSLSVFEPFTPQLHALTGEAQARLALAGTLQHPRISGTASLTNGSATLLATGIRLQHAQVHATLAPNGDKVSFEAKAASGPGALRANGQLTGLATGHPQLAMKVNGNRFQAIDLPQVQAQANPELTIAADPKQIKVRGKVTIPEAKIRVHRLPAKATDVSSDTEVVGQAPARAYGPAIDAQIELALGRQVRIEAFGLGGNLSGNLNVREQSGTPPTADGSLNIVNGTYQAYGLDLTLSRGRLNFAGAIDNPGLDVVAQRQTGPVTATLTVTGTLKSPHSDISATPPMSQADALSWLLTGHGINQASRSDAALLLRAIYSMNVQDNGGGLVSQIKQRTGLSDIGVKGGSTLQQSALVLGKYVTPKVYLRYTTGLFERMNTLSLTYQLSRHLSVEAQSGATQALDLLYQIEFGGS